MSNFDVGYKKPPSEHQFKKGVSGNPKGRPKGAKGLTTLVPKAFAETIIVIENGKERRISKLEAGFIQLANKAAKGDAKALKQGVQMLQEAEAKAEAREAPSSLTEADRDLLKVLPQLYDIQPEDIKG